MVLKETASSQVSSFLTPRCINVLTICIFVYIIIIIALSTNFTYRYYEDTICESSFWMLVRVSGIVIIVALIILLRFF